MAARTAGIDRSEEITSLSTYVYDATESRTFLAVVTFTVTS